jgi:Protein of unknown function (DUF1656)
MRYTELNLLGVYVAPIAPMMVAAWVLLIPVRRLADRLPSLGPAAVMGSRLESRTS